MRVEFVTLGGASDRLAVPSPTLRNWTDQLEEYGVHYTKRNNRNERVYYQSDIDIFAYLRDMKAEHGRKTTTKDLAFVLKDSGRFDLRSEEDAPSPVSEPSNRVELLSQEDIKELMKSERVKQFTKVIVDQATKNLKDDLVKEITGNIKQELEDNFKKSEEMMGAISEGNERVLDRLETYGRESEKGFFARLLGR